MLTISDKRVLCLFDNWFISARNSSAVDIASYSALCAGYSGRPKSCRRLNRRNLLADMGREPFRNRFAANAIVSITGIVGLTPYKLMQLLLINPSSVLA